jgi:hypothetical protein
VGKPKGKAPLRRPRHRSEDNSKRDLTKTWTKLNYMLLSHHQNAGQNHNMTIAKGSFENAAKFRYLAITLTNQNCIHD